VPDPLLTLLDEALASEGAGLGVLCIVEAGRVLAYRTQGHTRELAPSGAGPLLELLSEAARRAEAGVFSFRDPDRRTTGTVLVEPIEASRVLVGVTLGDATIASVRMKRLALALRSLG
jgi:hypothetical protein